MVADHRKAIQIDRQHAEPVCRNNSRVAAKYLWLTRPAILFSAYGTFRGCERFINLPEVFAATSGYHFTTLRVVRHITLGLGEPRMLFALFNFSFFATLEIAEHRYKKRQLCAMRNTRAFYILTPLFIRTCAGDDRSRGFPWGLVLAAIRNPNPTLEKRLMCGNDVRNHGFQGRFRQLSWARIKRENLLNWIASSTTLARAASTSGYLDN